MNTGIKQNKVAIAVPHGGSIRTATVASIIAMIKKSDCETITLFQEGSVIHRNRERLVNKAIELKCTHLLFVDTDMAFPPETLNTLLSRKKDIIGVNAHKRNLNNETTIKMSQAKWLKLKLDRPDITTAEAVGTGILLINLKVFKKITPPFFFWKVDKKGDTTMGEDFWFCEKARKSGYEIWVDLSLDIKHIGDYFY